MNLTRRMKHRVCYGIHTYPGPYNNDLIVTCPECGTEFDHLAIKQELVVLRHSCTGVVQIAGDKYALCALPVHPASVLCIGEIVKDIREKVDYNAYFTTHGE